MSDISQLRSEISALERECSQLASENNAMRAEINSICNSVQSCTYSLGRSYSNATSTLDNSTNIIDYSDQVLHSISDEQDHISFLYRSFKNIETANKKIRELNNKIYFEFANFRMVRKIVRAFIDNINLEMVKPELIYKSVEKEHLQSPDFWLSCAMLAIMHWKADEKEAADRALDQALKLDEHQTVLFFMSFNLLLGRKEAALKWFDCYLRMPKTGDDAGFILLLLHATNLREDADDEFTNRIKKYLLDEYERSKKMNDIDSIVELVKDHLVQYNSAEKFNFGCLRNYVKDYGTMSNVLSMAKDNAAILEFVETTNCSTRGKGYVYIEKFIEELLDTPDKKERAYTDEIAYNEMIIKCVGDLGRAEEEFKLVHTHAVAPLNLMQECIIWLFGTESAEMSEVARSNIFMLCREVVEDAANKYFSEYRAQQKDTHPVTIKDYSTEMNFRQKEKEVKKAEDFYAKKKAAQLATVKNTSMILCIVFAAIALAGGIALFIYQKVNGSDSLVFLILGAVIAVILAVCAIVSYFGNKKRIKDITIGNEEAAKRVKEIIETLFGEYAEYKAMYEENDGLANEIIFAIRR